MNIIVIGAGLAGAACAFALTQRGCNVTVLSQGGGASTLPVGLLAAHLSAQDIELSQLSRIGVSTTLLHARALLREGIDWQPSMLEQRLFFSPEKNERIYRAAAALPAWYETGAGHVLHKRAAWIKPQALVKTWLKQPGVAVREASVAVLREANAQWQALDAQDKIIAGADCLVIAAGALSGSLLAQCGHSLTMDNVSGSVAIGVWPQDCATTGGSRIINGNGSFLGSVAGDTSDKFWASGATYEREIYASPAEQQAASRLANQERLTKLLPAELLSHINAQFAAGQVQSWQGSRCTTSDRLPIVGLLQRGLYVCTAMGSRGLSFAMLCAELLASEITGSLTAVQCPVELRKLMQATRPVICR